jgi:formiminotetrahydrofolate cyclodeaminase
MAAGLVEKSGRLSSEHWIGAAAVGKRSAVVRKLATLLVDADVAAYTAYLQDARAARGRGAVARERIIEIPLSIVRVAEEVVVLGAQLVEHGNPRLRSDAYAAVQLGAAAARSASVTLADNVRDANDARLTEARALAKSASERARKLRAPGHAGGRGHGQARSEDSGRQ